MHLYSPDILRWATQIGHHTPISAPYFESSKRSRICGSHITVHAKITDGKITELYWQLGLCALGQAAAGLLSNHITDLTEDQFSALDSAIRQLITTGSAALPKPFETFSLLQIVHDHPSRHASVLLAFDALKDVFHQANSLDKIS